MRIFAAIDLSDGARAAIARVQAEIVSSLGDGARGLKAVRPEHMHLTLAFVGDAPEAVGAAIVERMHPDIEQAPFDLSFGGVGAFPPRGAPRILWLGVTAGASAAMTLQGAVAERFVAAGADLDRRPFQPHLTLGRWRDTSASVRVKWTDGDRRVATVEVAGVTLYQSRLSSSGPAYVRLAQSRLRIHGRVPACPSSP